VHNAILRHFDGGAVVVSRRLFVKLGSLALAAPWACGLNGGPEAAADGRLKSRPKANTAPLAPGQHALNLSSPRDGWLYIPTGYQHSKPAPLVIAFHGAGQSSSEWLGTRTLANQLGIVLLVPDSRDVTWDVVRGGFDVDVAFVDRALDYTFAHTNIDTKRIALAGFSDGASYALSLGLVNGDLVTHILAFSPGFVVDGQIRGKPSISITHGTSDGILPIDSTSRRIVPALRAQGYSVQYQEFDGGHTLPQQLGTQVFTWFAGSA
jgi:phospholipase/carboxylesterase